MLVLAVILVLSAASTWFDSNNKQNSKHMTVIYWLLLYRLIRHTEKLLEEKQEKLCIQVLETLKKMMKLENDYGDKVSQCTLCGWLTW